MTQTQLGIFLEAREPANDGSGFQNSPGSEQYCGLLNIQSHWEGSALSEDERRKFCSSRGCRGTLAWSPGVRGLEWAKPKGKAASR